MSQLSLETSPRKNVAEMLAGHAAGPSCMTANGAMSAGVQCRFWQRSPRPDPSDLCQPCGHMRAVGSEQLRRLRWRLNIVVDMLLRSTSENGLRDDAPANRAGAKRWIKEHVYAHLPIGFRAFLYFLYRYVFRLGFLDGLEGTAFHVQHSFWYRYLVDLKLVETKRYMANRDVPLETAIQDVLEIDVSIPEKHAPSR